MWRYATADFRAEPDFVILGAQRSGTTSLYRWLITHPDVAPASRKEVHFFDVHYDKGYRWYRAQFPFRQQGQITGEACPYMLFHPLAPSRAARDLPSTTKFIVLLREPVQRTVSHYWFSRTRRKRWETESLERAIELEPERLAGETERVLRGEVSPRHAGYSYVSRSEYAGQLEAWFEAVGRERILIIESQKLYENPATMVQILEWLGLPPHDGDFPTNKTNRSTRLGEENAGTLARLAEHFEPHNRKLFEMLGYELWTEPPLHDLSGML